MDEYCLVGVDGNAYSVMGYVAKAMRETGYTQEEIKAYYDKAMSSDYQNLLCVSVAQIDECNERL